MRRERVCGGVHAVNEANKSHARKRREPLLQGARILDRQEGALGMIRGDGEKRLARDLATVG